MQKRRRNYFLAAIIDGNKALVDIHDQQRRAISDTHWVHKNYDI